MWQYYIVLVTVRAKNIHIPLTLLAGYKPVVLDFLCHDTFAFDPWVAPGPSFDIRSVPMHEVFAFSFVLLQYFKNFPEPIRYRKGNTRLCKTWSMLTEALCRWRYALFLELFPLHYCAHCYIVCVNPFTYWFAWFNIFPQYPVVFLIVRLVTYAQNLVFVICLWV